MKKNMLFTLLFIAFFTNCKDDADFIKFSDSELDLTYHQEVTPAFSTNLNQKSFRFVSADTNFVEINANGKVTANHVTFNGKVAIFAYSGNVSAVCLVTVSPSNFLYRVPKVNYGAAKLDKVAIDFLEKVEPDYRGEPYLQEDNLLKYHPASNEAPYVQDFTYTFENNIVKTFAVQFLPTVTAAEVDKFLTERYIKMSADSFLDGSNSIPLKYNSQNNTVEYWF